jgi:hypothetical protein
LKPHIINNGLNGVDYAVWWDIVRNCWLNSAA